MTDLENLTLQGADGEIGRPEEFYFDDSTWSVRYVVVNTGSWLLGRRVLIAPSAIKGADKLAKMLTTSLTQEQVRNSPPMETEKPISRQYEEEYYRYYDWAPYWGAGIAAEPYPPPPRTVARSLKETDVSAAEIRSSHLRSSDEVTGYYVDAQDGEIGHIEDLVIDDQDWMIRYFEIDTRNWWPGKKVLVPRTWIQDIRWLDRKVKIGCERRTIQGAPEYDSAKLITPDYELKLFQYYSRAGESASNE